MTVLPTGPYLMRALYEWCVDSGLTPYISVRVDTFTRVPPQFVKDGQIVLNVGPNAVRDLHMDNEWVTFNARFGGVAQDIVIPVRNVLAIYARETGEGMAFPQGDTQDATQGSTGEGQDALNLANDAASGQDDDVQDNPPRPKGPPNLRVVK